MLKTLIIAAVLLPRLTIAQQSQQLPHLRQPSQWSPAIAAATAYRFDKAPKAVR
jgi:hypothetical protein